MIIVSPLFCMFRVILVLFQIYAERERDLKLLQVLLTYLECIPVPTCDILP